MGKKKAAKKKSGKTKKKAAKRRRHESPRERRMLDFAIVGMLLLAAYFAIFGGEYSIFEIRKLENIEKASSAELALTQAEIDSLLALANQIESDPVAIERLAREEYGMIRDGEILYRFRDVETDSTADSTRLEGEEE